MVMGRTVQGTGHSTDRYSRVVGEIGLVDGRDLGKELVKTGNAWWYAKFDPYDAEMEDLEAAARERRIGLWEAYNPLPPWEWRKIGHPRGRSRTAPR